MMRTPMDPVEAGKRAQRLLAEHERRKKGNATRSDDEAFQQIKRSGKLKDLDAELREALGL